MRQAPGLQAVQFLSNKLYRFINFFQKRAILFRFREQPIFTCKAHVFHIDPKTKRSWLAASSSAVNVSFFYDSSRSQCQKTFYGRKLPIFVISQCLSLASLTRNMLECLSSASLTFARYGKEHTHIVLFLGKLQLRLQILDQAEHSCEDKTHQLICPRRQRRKKKVFMTWTTGLCTESSPLKAPRSVNGQTFKVQFNSYSLHFIFFVTYPLH